MKIVLVSNKPDLQKDYTDFVNSCDVVVRINKLDSIKYNKTGNKTDIIIMRTWYGFYEHPEAFIYLDIMKNAKMLFMSSVKEETLNMFRQKLNCNEKITIIELKKNTAVIDALEVLRNIYPNEKIYYIGDKSTFRRTNNDHHNNSLNNDIFFHGLEENGILIPIINDENYLEFWVNNGSWTGYYTVINKNKIIYNDKIGRLEHIRNNNYYKIIWNTGLINYLDIENKHINSTYIE